MSWLTDLFGTYDQRAAARDARREDREDRIALRQSGRTDRVYERQTGHTDRVMGRQEGRSIRTNYRQYARVQTADSRNGLLGGIYDNVHSSASEVGSAILGMYGLDVDSQTERDIAAAQAAAASAAAAVPMPTGPGGMSTGTMVLGALALAAVGYAVTK